MTHFFKSLALAGTVALVAAGPALADTKSFDFSGFTRVDARAGLEVEIVAGAGFEVIAEGSSRALSHLEVTRRGDTLVLGREIGPLEWLSPILWLGNNNVNLRVVLPSLAGVDASSGSDVVVNGAYAADFEAAISSGADLELVGLDADRVWLEASSGGAVEAVGFCRALEVEASSGAVIEAEDLACERAAVDASSGASVSVSAGELRVSASSGARVAIHDGHDVEAETSSGGKVTREE